MGRPHDPKKKKIGILKNEKKFLCCFEQNFCVEALKNQILRQVTKDQSPLTL